MRIILQSALVGNLLLLLVVVTKAFVPWRELRPYRETPQFLNCKSSESDSLSWLTSRLGLDQDQAASMVAGHPPLIDYSVDKNLEPTVSFYEDALGGNPTALLCELPGLLEYNVHKRLRPRLELVRQVLDGPLDNPSVIAIATKTDSRFEEWLRRQKGEEEDLFQARIPDDIERTPPCYMVLSNLQSGGNIGNILRSASIFGCDECLVVGQKRYRLTGEHNSRHNLPRRHFWTHADAKVYLQAKGIRVYGIEIMKGASPLMRYDPVTGVVHFPFHRQWQGAAFVMGNEGEGLSVKQREICDEFIFIPQTRGATSRSGDGSASLNVACAATVVLQAYSTWACYPDANLEGEKFLS